jgi:DNA-binding transcriptional regulator YiaG
MQKEFAKLHRSGGMRMSTRKIYAGARLGEIRRGLGLTQTAFARELAVSLSYLMSRCSRWMKATG